MAQKTLTTSYLAQLTNANHDGVTQQIDDRLQGFETDNMMLQQAVSGVHTARQGEDAAYRRYSGKDFASDDLKREDVFVTTKLWGAHGYGDTMRSIENSLRAIDLDYIDLFLIHEPSGDFISQYQAMEDARQMGLLRSIGVANFMEENYLRLVGSCRVVPAVNQIETHVYRQQARMHRLLAEHSTWHESWSPLACGQNGFFRDPVLKRIAEAHGKSIAQVGLRWLLQQGIDVIPKTTHRERMQENLDLFDFELTTEEMQDIKTLDTGRSQFGWW